MSNDFLIFNDKVYTYDNLINEINDTDCFNRYVYVENNMPYEVFKRIIHSIVYDYPIELIDGDFSDNEIQKMDIPLNDIKTCTVLLNNKHQIKDYNCLISMMNEKIKSSKQDWSLSLYTSGTTGRPKKITHTLQSITRNVKVSERHKDDVWGFAYNPTHMAGIQVFFQALFNGNKIIYIFDDARKNVKELLEKYKITHISATATYYRNILPYLKSHKFDYVRNITLGGEKCDEKLLGEISKIFPDCRMKNIYASTEAGSLFVSNGEDFEIPAEIREFIKINDRDELLINKKLLGFSENFNLQDDWYNTNDIVEKISENKFRFKSRKTDMINVGGYKVNSLEVEEIILEIDGILNVYVYGRENKVTGNIVAADIVMEDGFSDTDIKKKIRNHLEKSLQSWKIPRIINIVDKLEQTRTGKKVRK